MSWREANAERIARELHLSQKDKSGAPYIRHLEGVVANLLSRWPDAPSFAVEAAWLHDVLEDTPATAAALRGMGVSAEAVAIVEAVSRPEGKTYREWIDWLAEQQDRWAIRVKLADLLSNMDPARAYPGMGDMVERRYRPAFAKLEAALGESVGPPS